MSAATIISQAFGEGANLYTEVLDTVSSTKSLTASQLRKAYYKRALVFHPDKQDPSKKTKEELEEAKLKFQAVSIAYNILSDPDKRQEYDDSGEINDADDDFGSKTTSGTTAWTDYFRGIFGSVTKADIDKFTLQYKCSNDEEQDVLKYYEMFKGNLNKMLECVMCSSNIDKKRWSEDYILPAIENGEIDDYRKEMNRTSGENCIDLDVKVITEKMDTDDDSKTETDEDSGVEKESVGQVKGGKQTRSSKSCAITMKKKKPLLKVEKLKDKKLGFKKIVVTKSNIESKSDYSFISIDESKTESEEDSEVEIKSVQVGQGKQRRSSKRNAITTKKQKLIRKEKVLKPSKNRREKIVSAKSKGIARSDDSLIAAITQKSVVHRREAFGSMIAGLEERYTTGAKGSKKDKSKKDSTYISLKEDIPDDEFEKIRARLSQQKVKRGSKS